MGIHSGRAAIACIRGDSAHPNLRGRVKFIPMHCGTQIVAEIEGLPDSETGFFAFHIHTGEDCGGVGFADTQGHFNPGNAPHPEHAGDLPPLLSNGGKACLSLITGRFQVRDVIGKTVVIHASPDDFHTQPSGNAGTKIACGTIKQL